MIERLTLNINRLRHLGMMLVLLLLAFPAIAQNGPSKKARQLFDDGMNSFRAHRYSDAEKKLKKAIEEAPTWGEPYALYGSILELQGRKEEALDVYVKLTQANPQEEAGWLNAGTLSAKMGRSQDAINYYEKYLQLTDIPANRRQFVEKKLQGLKTVLTMKANPVPFNPERLGPEINTPRHEYLPTFTVDGEQIYFTRRKIADSIPERDMYRYNEDLMTAHRSGNKWTDVKDLPPSVNTIDNEAAMAISPDGSFMVFTGCERPDGEGSCDLYISFFRNGEWTRVVNLGAPVNTRWKESLPSISADGRTIYFSSNRPGGVGKLDIWMTTRDDQWNFGEPVNLGPEINTTEDEQTPFIHTDDRTLYFCSNGWPGMGQNDIFVARRKPGGGWTEPKNLGYPINTESDEQGLVVDRMGEYAYFASEANSKGNLEIYRFQLPKEARPDAVTYLKGKVIDKYSKTPLQASLELVDLSSGQTMVKGFSDDKGELLAVLPSGKDYMVNVAAEGYTFYSANIPLKDYKRTEPYEQTIALNPIKVGEVMTLNNVFFQTDKAELRPESKSELDRLVRFMMANPNVKIEVGGHTDNTGTAARNTELSLQRARAVYDYLVTQGRIPPARLKYKGYGDTKPVAKNTTEEGRAQNRRTEVKIVE